VIRDGADGIKDLTTPLSDADVQALKAGDRVRITGVIYTARDAAHGRLFPLIEKGERLPIDVKGQIIYYTGPSPARPGDVVGSIGPTTGGRMDKFTPALLELGLKGTIGKGARSQPVKDALKRYQGVYLGAIGGAGAVLSQFVSKSSTSWPTKISARRRFAGSKSKGFPPSC
jgi:fumarate hydratase subunit beta